MELPLAAFDEVLGRIRYPTVFVTVSGGRLYAGTTLPDMPPARDEPDRLIVRVRAAGLEGAGC